MEDSIKKGDFVKIVATDEQLAKIGITKSNEDLRERKNEVDFVQGKYAVVNGLTIPVIFLQKCEQ